MPSIDLTPYYQPQGSTSDGNKYDNGLALIQSTMNALDNNNVAANAAIVASKLNGLATVLGTQNVGAANTDLQGPGASRSDLYVVTTGTGTLRSIAAPTENGSRVVIRNASGSSITLKHQLAGGAGAQLYLRTVADVTLLDKELVEFVYDGTNWVEIGRDQASAGGFVSGEMANSDLATFTNITATTEATAQTFATVTFTADGTTAYVLDADWYATKGTTWINFALYMDGTDQGVISTPTTSVQAGTINYRWARRLTPAAGAHTFTLRGWVDAGTGTAGGGAGGAGVALAGYFRGVKA